MNQKVTKITGFRQNAEEDIEIVDDHVPLDDDENQQLKRFLKTLSVSCFFSLILFGSITN